MTIYQNGLMKFSEYVQNIKQVHCREHIENMVLQNMRSFLEIVFSPLFLSAFEERYVSGINVSSVTKIMIYGFLKICDYDFHFLLHARVLRSLKIYFM